MDFRGLIKPHAFRVVVVRLLNLPRCKSHFRVDRVPQAPDYAALHLIFEITKGVQN